MSSPDDVAAAADTSHPEQRVSRLGFGSCNNQRRPQDVFRVLRERAYDAFVLTGDAVYGRSNGVEALRAAYEELEREGTFREFADSVGHVVGTWDDHDFGVNDGGREAPDLGTRRDLYLDFLGVDKHDVRRFRKGVYASHDFGRGNETVRVILLDTRFGRSAYPLSWVGAVGAGRWYGKFFAVISSAARAASSMSGWTEHYALLTHQVMLDREQWGWLERQLQSSPAQVNILVSSVQVLTMNPTVESWGHFPFELKKLMRLVRKTKPRGFLMLSGDVHVGEILAPPGLPLIEVTSSGLTHSCLTHFPKWLCQAVWGVFATNARTGILFSRNFGEIDIDWNERVVHVTVRNADNATEALHVSQTFDRVPDFRVELVPSIIPTFQTQTVIVFSLLLTALSVVHVFMALTFRVRGRRRVEVG